MGVSDIDGFTRPQEPISGQDEAQLSEWDLRHALTVVLYSLPNYELVHGGVPRYDQGDIATWLAEVTAWLAEYKKVAARQWDDHLEQTRTLNQFITARNAIRAFLGNDQGD